MKENRKGERGNPPPRSSRIFHMENLWYFATREGTDVGPFHSRDEASGALQDFLDFIQLAHKNTLKAFLSALSAKEQQSLFS
ncbi:MAG: DUF6316 family protein [Pseudomonadales bacterium]|jgi:hypothetical protein